MTRASNRSLELQTPGGAKVFAIRPSELEGLDVPHLIEHQDAGEPIKLYYEPTGGTDYAMAYEDA